MKNFNIDQKDKTILKLLQKDANLSIKFIARSIELSSPPTLRRINKLKKRGFLTHPGYVINDKLMGDFAKFIIKCKVEDECSLEFISFIRKEDAVRTQINLGEVGSYILICIFQNYQQWNDFKIKLINLTSSRTFDIITDTIVKYPLPDHYIENA